jgi:hypothetical protein
VLLTFRRKALIAFSSLFLLPAGAAVAQETPANAKDPSQLHHANPLPRAAYSPEEILTSLRDTGLSLEQLKQQAINIFLEGTRTKLSVNEPQKLTFPQSLTANDLKLPNAKFLQPRKDWLVFYMNTMEPVMHLLNEDVKDVEKRGLGVPDALSKELQPLWKGWRSEITAINSEMDSLQELIAPENGTNEGIAKVAVAIYQHGDKMEKIRDEAANMCSREYSKNAKP